MNKASELIDSLWMEGDNFKKLHTRLKHDEDVLDPVHSSVIGKELFSRLRALSTPEFAMAAYLASGGLAGNDGLSDFRDCLSILPFERYSRILANHDELVADPVSHDFDEYSFLGIFERGFESVFGEEGEGLLEYLVGEDSPDSSPDRPGVDARALFPRLFERHGHLLDREAKMDSSGDKVTLADFGID